MLTRTQGEGSVERVTTQTVTAEDQTSGQQAEGSMGKGGEVREKMASLWDR